MTPPTVSIGVDKSYEFLVVLSFDWLVVVVNPAFIFTLFSVVACRAIAIRIAGVDESRAFLVALSSSSSSFDWLVVVVVGPSFVFTHFSFVVFCLALAVSPCWRRVLVLIVVIFSVIEVDCRRRIFASGSCCSYRIRNDSRPSSHDSAKREQPQCQVDRPI